MKYDRNQFLAEGGRPRVKTIKPNFSTENLTQRLNSFFDKQIKNSQQKAISRMPMSKHSVAYAIRSLNLYYVPYPCSCHLSFPVPGIKNLRSLLDNFIKIIGSQVSISHSELKV